MRLSRRLRFTLAALVLVAGGHRPTNAAERMPVVATFSILADLARQVGGERVEVVSLVGPNGDTHVYEPKPDDARALADAKLVLVNGFGLEGWLDRLVVASETKAPVIVATKGIAPRLAAGGRGVDPHAWQSIANAKVYVANIRDALAAVDPAGADLYRTRARDYAAHLDALEDEVRAAIAKIPAERRRIITTHDAFGYFGDAYGFTFIAPEGVSTDTEASAADVARIIAQIRAEHVPAVFLENVSDNRLIDEIARESGARVGGVLFSDALSPPGGPAGTYIDMMRNNIRELGKALLM